MYKNVDSKPDFPALEKEIKEKWEKEGLLKKYLTKNNSSSKTFSFLDGPITANNPMGVHHAWGRTYKDFWQRFFNMNSYKQRFQNGFDEQGLWVEVEVEKDLGLNSKKEIENLVPGDVEKSIAQFIQLCKDRVKKYAAIQTEQSKRLGYFMDWDNSYHTSSEENNYAIWNFLKKVFEDGNLYKGHDTVPWCPRCGTAISQHEILTEEYKEINHDTVFFKLPVLGKDFSLLAWTTTPWTIPANVALAVNPKFTYRVWKTADGEKIVTVNPKEIADPEQHSWFEKNVMAVGNEGVIDIKGEDLVGLEYKGPFDDLPLVQKAKAANHNNFHRVIAAEDLVVASKGTGILHVVPGAGEEDYKLAKENNLPVIAPIEEDASYVKEMGEFASQNAKEKPGIIISYLKEKEGGKYLLKTQQLVHRYPTCWRCKTELVWRVVDEWYIAMDKPANSKLKTQNSKLDGETYREQMIEVTKKIKWIPSWGKERELDWLKNMHDWLISKKRYWGLALPIYECQKCHHFEVIGSKEELEKRSVEGWASFSGHTPHRPWIDNVKIKCLNCGELVSRIKDVGNPWLDAGIVPFSTLPEEWFPADLVGESFPGQFKNWFYSMIAMATVLKKTNPFKTLFGYASMRDEKGEEMHKSKGNAIWFDQGADKIGVDVMRWLFVTHNPELNLGFGYNVTDQVRRQFFLTFWNVYKFFIDYANVDNFTAKKITVPDSKAVLDRWILSRLNQLITQTMQSFSNYTTHEGTKLAEIFLQDLSVWYVRRIRDRVGPTVPDSEDKTNAYQTLHYVLVTFCQLLAPAIPYTTEMIYTNLTDEESVHLSNWPTVVGTIDPTLIGDMEVARQIVEKGHSIRKENTIKVRQPLALITYRYTKKLAAEIEKIVLQELNIKNIAYEKGEALEVKINTQQTKQLIQEGEARELVRQIQEQRKELKVNFNDPVKVILPKWPKEYEDYIKKETLATSLEIGPSLAVSRGE